MDSNNANSATNTETVVVTREFLEEALKTRVEKFVVSPGSTPGDGYTCVMYCIDVWKIGRTVREDDKPLHILIKSFPTNPARQYFLDLGLFPMELGMYEHVIPELMRFQDENAQIVRKIRLPFAPFLGGKYTSKEERIDSEGSGHFRNYIIMMDLRKSGGFRLKDRFDGLDLDHYKLVVEAQATLHALSWAYKSKSGTKLSEKCPSLRINAFANVLEGGGKGIFTQNLQIAEDILKNDDPERVEGLKHLHSVFWAAVKLYYDMELDEDEKHYTKDNILRIPGPALTNEEPWEVLLHGDAWSNNMVFRYDQATGKPVEVIFIDLQVSREGDPFTDINYALYVSTSKDLRRKHLTSMLHLYYDTFERICAHFSVPTLPGWSWEEFNRRFHRAQMFGMCMAVSVLPVTLMNPDEVVDMENMEISKDDVKSGEFADSEAMKKLKQGFLSTKLENPVLKSRLTGAVADAIRRGILGAQNLLF